MNQHGTMFLLLLIFSSSVYESSTSTKSSNDSSSLTNPATDNGETPPTSDNPNSINSTCAPSCVNNSAQSAPACICGRTLGQPVPTTIIPQAVQDDLLSIKLCLAMILLLLALTSSGFLVAYLRTSFKKKGPKTLLLKITSSYCLTLLSLYIASVISFIFLNVKGLCLIRAAEMIMQYCIYSLLLWSCIITYECWQCFIRFKDYKVDSNQSKRRRHAEYIIRCCLAWITPILISVNSYFCPPVQFSNKMVRSEPYSAHNDTPLRSLRCPQFNHNVNDHLLGWANFVVDQHSSSPINLIVTVVLAMLIILSFVHICVRFRALLVEVGDADMNSSKKKRRYRFVVYAKLLCVTGTFWIISPLLIFLDKIFPSIGTILVCFLVTAYGILLYISLGKKNHSIYNILRGHMNRDFIRRFPDGVSMSQVRMTR